MELCDIDHDQILYFGENCPVCEANLEIRFLEKVVAALEEKIKDLEGEV